MQVMIVHARKEYVEGSCFSHNWVNMSSLRVKNRLTCIKKADGPQEISSS